MCPARYLEKHMLRLYPRHKQDQPTTLLSWGLGPHPNWDSKPPPLSPRLRAVQGPPNPKTTMTVGPKRAGTHDKRVTSLPYAHTQVCAQDNKICDLPSVLCNGRSLTDTDRESSVTKLCPTATATQPLTPTNTQTISLPGHHFSFPPFIFSK